MQVPKGVELVGLDGGCFGYSSTLVAAGMYTVAGIAMERR